MQPATTPAFPVTSGRTALLVFARSAAAELAVRGFPRGFAPLVDSGSRLRNTGPSIDPHFFVESSLPPGGAAGASVHFHAQVGGDFRERLCNAVDTAADLGYAHIVIVGGDCPDLTADDITRVAALLHETDAVFGPDHQGGLYLIGIHAADRHLLNAVVWQRNTDCDQLRSLYSGRRISLLPVKLDLDTWDDLQLFVRLDGALHRWLSRQLAWLAGERTHPLTVWIDLAQHYARALCMTSPPRETD